MSTFGEKQPQNTGDWPCLSRAWGRSTTENSPDTRCRQPQTQHGSRPAGHPPTHLCQPSRQAGNVSRQLSIRAAAVALQLRNTPDQQLLLQLGCLDLLQVSTRQAGKQGVRHSGHTDCSPQQRRSLAVRLPPSPTPHALPPTAMPHRLACLHQDVIHATAALALGSNGQRQVQRFLPGRAIWLRRLGCRRCAAAGWLAIGWLLGCRGSSAWLAVGRRHGLCCA